jgi:hypothetical protein
MVAALGAAKERADSASTIGDIEALLIQSLGTHHRGNAMEMRFSAAEHWTQVMLHEYDHYLDRLEGRRTRARVWGSGHVPGAVRAVVDRGSTFSSANG